ncbi:uncharacterized protein EURHEDRAFT_414885 [Aspergillus ruber CBS 135680]|uniref:Arrestin-like N-terminal domain-containing protein n=1 Tax=Aspergillus ruber (strain CBS 135680) TaxID=1388766 RepID=A0A017S7X4_ASPRC|nr:uncharacterized protein EURHEDRAFT_414885 [Aspergillus ruber CBS 135680]EYE92936.1 hypothetical protein EURHEDRAFT_414885 [Aspergillus ruber CBS 135680]
MPQTRETRNADLQIDLASPPGWTFAPGDTVIGTVLRHSHIVAPKATVTLSLVGHVRTKITPNGSSSRGYYRGHWYLFSTTTTQVLFEGPLHAPKDSSSSSSSKSETSWSFSLPIPTKPADSALGGHYNEEGFLPQDKYGIAHHTLPGTFVTSNNDWNHSSEGYVEYYLEAQLQYHQWGMYRFGRATVPIIMRPQAPVVFPDCDLQRHTVDQGSLGQWLLPGKGCTDRKFMQKTQRLLGSSRVPRAHYSVEIGLPRIIQLDNTSSIPLTLNIVLPPQQGMTNSTDMHNVGLKIRLNWIKMSIKSTTTLLAPRDARKLLTKSDSHSVLHNLNLERAFRDLDVPIEFFIDKTRNNGPVNIGSMFQLVLRSNGLKAKNRRLASVPYPYIQPDLITYNIRHSHRLVMEVSLTIAGERHTVPVSGDVMILAAS